MAGETAITTVGKGGGDKKQRPSIPSNTPFNNIRGNLREEINAGKAMIMAGTTQEELNCLEGCARNINIWEAQIKTLIEKKEKEGKR